MTTGRLTRRMLAALLVLATLECASGIVLKIRCGSFSGCSRSDPSPEMARGSIEPDQLRAARSSSTWMLHPYFGFVRDPSTRVHTLNGRVVATSVNAHGFFGPSPWTRRDDRTFTILLTGGSVALELFLESSQVLVDELQSLPSASGREIRIVCTALDGMKQPQQLLILDYFLVLGASWDLVVTLDGFNEIVLPLVDNLERGVFPLFPRRWDEFSELAVPLSVSLSRGRIASMRDVLTRSRAGTDAGLLRWSRSIRLWREHRLHALEEDLARAERELLQDAGPRHHSTGPTWPSPDGPTTLKSLASTWARSLRQISSSTREAGVASVHFLQPNQYSPGSRELTDNERREAWQPEGAYGRRARAGYPFLIEAAQALRNEGVHAADLTEIFRDVDADVYRDDCCHLTSAGYDLLARTMAKHILESPVVRSPSGSRR